MHPANPPTIPAPTPPQETLEASLLAALARKELFSKLSTFAFSLPPHCSCTSTKKKPFFGTPYSLSLVNPVSGSICFFCSLRQGLLSNPPPSRCMPAPEPRPPILPGPGTPSLLALQRMRTLISATPASSTFSAVVLPCCSLRCRLMAGLWAKRTSQ